MEYHQHTKSERYLILHYKSKGYSLRKIGEMLNRRASTVSRELKRNVSRDGRYRPDTADSYAKTRRWRSRRGTQFEAADIELVHDLVRRKWSPEQVSMRLRKLRQLNIGTATIYRILRRDRVQGGITWQQLRQLSHRYRKGYRVVDRKTRKLRMIKLAARQACEVNKALIKEARSGRLKMKSLTLGNGTEFHRFKELEEKLGIQVYFAQPYHSWERGTNENTNGPIRQYLPKRTCFKELTQRQCNVIERELNNRPRKVLGFDTPNEAEAEECCT